MTARVGTVVVGAGPAGLAGSAGRRAGKGSRAQRESVGVAVVGPHDLSIPLRFVFDDPVGPELSREWIEELAHSANTSGGILLVAEHFDTGAVDVVDDASRAIDHPSDDDET